MARRPKLTGAALAKLGAKRLAALLMSEAATNRNLKRTLQLELDSAHGVDLLVNSITKRLSVIDDATSGLSTNQARELKTELERIHATIVERVGEEAPDAALDLLWQFLDLHQTVLERVFDRSGTMADVFRAVVPDLGQISAKATIAREHLAADVMNTLMTNEYGIADELIPELAEALGHNGLKALQAMLLQARDQRRSQAPPRGGRAHHYDHTLLRRNLALQAVADALGDVDAYIDAQSDRDPTNSVFASEIGVRLVGAGRAEEALAILDAAQPSDKNRHFPEREWTDARIAALEALKRDDEAQALRWHIFAKELSPTHLRAHLKRLPDFDDIEAEERALDEIADDPRFHGVLWFLVKWPSLVRAARLVEDHPDRLDGDLYQLLNPAAQILEARHPLAASLIRRSLVTFTLENARSSRYGHAARHIRELEALDIFVDDYGPHETHDAFMNRLKVEHSRKHGFWSRLDAT